MSTDDDKPLWIWTDAMVMGRLREAAQTLRVVGAGDGRPAAKLTFWPDTLGERFVDYAPDVTVVRPTRATPEQITRMDQTLGWIAQWLSHEAVGRFVDPTGRNTWGLVPDAAWVVWARANGWSYTRLSAARQKRHGVPDGPRKRGPSRYAPGGNTRQSLDRIVTSTLAYLAHQLNQTTTGATAADVEMGWAEGYLSTPRRRAGTDDPMLTKTEDGIRTIAPARLHVNLEDETNG